MHGTPLKLNNTLFEEAHEKTPEAALDNPLFASLGSSNEQVGMGSSNQACLQLRPAAQRQHEHLPIFITAVVPQATPAVAHDNTEDNPHTWSRRFAYMEPHLGELDVLCCCERTPCAWHTRAVCVR